ncbi:hypothetical protein ACTXT7_002594 [Hymenolepis weldensis]
MNHALMPRTTRVSMEACLYSSTLHCSSSSTSTSTPSSCSCYRYGHSPTPHPPHHQLRKANSSAETAKKTGLKPTQTRTSTFTPPPCITYSMSPSSSINEIYAA